MTASTRNSFRRRLAGVGLVLAGLVQSACVTVVAPPTAYQGDVGRVAFVAGDAVPRLHFAGFAHGKGEGAALGAGAGFAGCLSALGHGGCSGAACGPIVIIMLGICGVASVAGGVVGATAAPGAQAVRADEAAAAGAFAVSDIQAALRAHIAATALERGQRMVEPPPQAAPARTGAPDYRNFAAYGVDTVLEATLVEAGTRGAGIDEPVAGYMAAHVRLVRTADGREVFARDYTYLGARHTFAAWAADGGRRLLQMLEAGYSGLGEHIYESVFVLYPFPDRDPHGAGLLAAAFGLAPLAPRTRGQLTGDPLIGPRFEWTAVASLRPTLEWERFPRPGDLRAAPDDMARVRRVRYDLVIAREDDGIPGDIVYRRDGLDAARHRLDVPLAPDTRYFWTVRARFELDGRERLTEWASTHYVARDQFNAPSRFSFRFRTP